MLISNKRWNATFRQENERAAALNIKMVKANVLDKLPKISVETIAPKYKPNCIKIKAEKIPLFLRYFTLCRLVIPAKTKHNLPRLSGLPGISMISKKGSIISNILAINR